jgi:hypothetical protein
LTTFRPRFDHAMATAPSEDGGMENQTPFLSRQMTPLLSLSLTVIALSVFPQTLHAAPVTYTLTGVGSGTFSGESFFNRGFTLTGIGDTTITTTIFGFPAIPLSSMTYSVSGFPLATTNDPFYLLNAHPDLPYTLFFMDSLSQQTASFVVADVSMGAWNMTSNIGPLASTYGASDPTATNQGNVDINSFTSASFTANVSNVSAPEPCSLALLALGGVSYLTGRRK